MNHFETHFITNMTQVKKITMYIKTNFIYVQIYYQAKNKEWSKNSEKEHNKVKIKFTIN